MTGSRAGPAPPRVADRLYSQDPERETHPVTSGRIPLAALATVLAMGAPLAGSAAAGEPLAFWGGRLRLGGEVSGTYGSDDLGFFNYTDYETSMLRLFRVDLAAEVRLASAAALVGEIRSDNVSSLRVYALYLRVRPWAKRAFDLQAGLIPPVFGAYPRRRYALDNPLPSVPLAYQYLLALRDDAVPANADQLVAQRGRGWQVRYPVGSTTPAPGFPLANGQKWDAGVEAQLGLAPLSLAVAVTQGTLCYPLVRDDNGGKQVSARVAWTHAPDLTVGLSGAVGQFLSREVTSVLPPSAGGNFRQRALGADVEFARGYWIVRGEAVWSRWNLPALEAPLLDVPLDALGLYAEARYKIRPGLHAAGRVEHLGLSDVGTTLGSQPWEAAVTRYEVGGGYALHRQVLLKASVQHNRRPDGGRVRKNTLLAAQVLLWF